MKRFCPNILAGLLVLLAAPALHAVPEQLTDAGNTADFPDVRVDSGGNRHLVWYDADLDNGAIFYRLFNSSGALLIDTTQINDSTGSAATRPAMELDSSGRIFVVWENTAEGEVYLLRLEPFLDDLDGSTADIGVIKTLDDTRISSDGDGVGAVHPRMTIDDGNGLHVVWEDDCGTDVQYVKLDGDGALLNGPVLLGGGGSCNDRPDIAVDSADNVHVVFSNTGNTTAEEVYYAKLDGATGDVLIDSTLLTVDDGLLATHATLGVDLDDDKVYVVYGQVTAAGAGEEIFMAALDHLLDDQDGSSADPAVIRLTETRVSSGTPQFDWRAFGRFGFDRRMHVTYLDFDAAGCQGAGAGGPFTVFHSHITTAGSVLARQTLTTTGAVSDACEPEARMAPIGNRLVWAGEDQLTGAVEIFSDTFTRVSGGSSGFTCSLGHAGSAWRAGDLWLLLATLAALGLLRRRLRSQ